MADADAETFPDLKKTSQELAKHFDLSVKRLEGFKEIRNNVENVSNQMEEIKESLELVRQDVGNRTELASKELFDTANQLDALFSKIDFLEQFVNIVKKTVNDVNDRVDETENLLTNPISRVLDTIKLNTAKSIDNADLMLAPMKPLNIYHTLDYFPRPPPKLSNLKLEN
ncbi:hypothetical protein G9A89_008290 [Geosiphon pyriformis]|nr:hypothetical protein G9A89_008290 [Geosiphon pyriformis]